MNFDVLRTFRLVLSLVLAALIASPAVTQDSANAQSHGSLISAGYKLNHWSMDEGAPSRVNDFAQSTDGFLWIGGVEGLFRFDGVTFEKVAEPPVGEPRIIVSRLMASRTGAVWVGLARSQGVRVWRGGRLVDSKMPNPSREVNDIQEDGQGAVWVARGGRGTNALARFAAGRWTEFGSGSGLPEQPIWNILFTHDGTQWIVLEKTIYVRRRGAARFEPTGLTVSPRASLAEDSRGRLWLADLQQTRQISPDGQGYRLLAPVFSSPQRSGGTRILVDRAGDLWETTVNKGIFRLALPADDRAGAEAGQLATLNAKDGLLSDQVRTLFEDREGNLWIGTELGINMLRRVPVRIVAAIPENSPTSYQLAVDRDGVVYVAESSGLYEIRPDKMPTRRLRTNSPIEALCADWREGVWFVTGERVARLTAKRLRYYPKPEGLLARSCGHDSAGRLWLPALQRGLFWLEGDRWHRWPTVGKETGLPGNTLILSDGRAAIHFRERPPVVARAPFVAVSDASVVSGGVEGLLAGSDTLLVSGSDGLSAPLLSGRPLLSSRANPWGVSLNGLVQTRSGDTWAIGDQGILHVKSADLARAFRQPRLAVPYEVFDFQDGLNSFVQKSPGAQAVVGGDGRLWFATRRNIVTIDPRDMPRNTLPPTVVITGLSAGKQQFEPADALAVPAATTRVEIVYTVTSLSVPQRVRFRYRLRGLSDRWIDAGGHRSAAFIGLGPGDYTFELVAANDAGVWSLRPTKITFSIPAAFYQRWWFWILVTLAAAALLYVAYSLRLRYVSGLIHGRLLERTRERERIARELHDTMIQGVQGLIMRFQAVADHLSHDEKAQAVLVPALDRAEEMLVEGRDRVTGLRRQEEGDLHAEIERLLRGQTFDDDTRLSLGSRGVPRTVAIEITDEIVAIVGEALRNAARHAKASEVEVMISYGRLGLGVFVRDDGIGISPDVQSTGGKPGHFGLLGIRERAKRIKASLSIESGKGFGTLIDIRVPGKLAYARRPERFGMDFGSLAKSPLL